MDQSEYSLLMSQYGPSAEDKAAARNFALMRAGMGILAANQPSPVPRSSLGILAQGGAQGVDAYATDLKQRTDERKSSSLMAMQAIKMKKDLASQAALKNFYTPQQQPQQAPGGNPMVPGPYASLMAGSGDTVPEGPPAAPPAPTPAQPPDFDSLIAAGVPAETVKAMMEAWKLRNPELKFDGGIARNPRTGMPMSDVPATPQTNPQGFSTTPRFNHQSGQFEIGMTPGGPEAYRRQVEIGEVGKAAFDLVSIPDGKGGTIMLPRSVAAERLGGGAQPPAGPAVPGPARPGGSLGYQAPESIRTAERTVAEGDAKRVLDLEAKIPNMLSVERRLSRMEGLTKDDQTYAAAGAEIKGVLGSVVQSFGLNVNKAKTANTEEYLAHVAELLKDRLASKDFGSGSGVSNLDIIAAQKPLPELAKTSQGRMQIIAALRADTQRNLKDAQSARDFFDENKSLRRFRFPSEVDAERLRKIRDLPKEPGAPSSALPQGVTVRRIR